MDPSTIASYSLIGQSPGGLEIETAQAAHRIRLVAEWQIPKGSRVLELGCGQGNATIVLAEAIGDAPTSHIDAVDPGAPDYGAPVTLSQAQQHVSAGPVGSRITWHQAHPEEFLSRASSSEEQWDVAVLAHCIWYFSSADELSRILRALLPRVKKLCVAEYSLAATETGATPHVLAALTRGMLEGTRVPGESVENIRCPLSPAAITEVAAQAGWKVERQSSVVPAKELADGLWEVYSVADPEFLQSVDKYVEAERLRIVLRSGRQATMAAVEAVGGNPGVRTMDVWVASFTK